MSQNKIHITAPFSPETVQKLRAGDQVLISGTILTARDAAHKRLIETLEKGEKLPLNLEQAVIYYTGPTPARPNLPIGSAGPTTSGRMDKYTPPLIEKCKISGMIGKGYRSGEVTSSIKKYAVPYLVTLGGAGALIAKSIKKYTVLAYEDLGAEAIAAMEVEDFPAIVAIDVLGNNFYEQGQAPYKEI